MSVERDRSPVFKRRNHFYAGCRLHRTKGDQGSPVRRRRIAYAKDVTGWLPTERLPASCATHLTRSPTIQRLESRIESPDAPDTGSNRDLRHRQIGLVDELLGK